MKRAILHIFALFALVLSGCYDSHTEPLLPIFDEQDNCDIAELQALSQNGCYDVIHDMVCVCRVTSSDREGNFCRSIVVEDQSGGAEIKLGIYNSASQYPIGLLIALRLNGCSAMFNNGVLQIGLPPQEHDALPRELASQEIIDQHIVRSNDVEMVVPNTYDIASLDSTVCGRFIAIEGLLHAPLNEEESLTEGYSRFVDKNGEFIYLYISPYANFAANEMPTSTVNIQGILYREKVGEDIGEQFVIKPRFADDISTTDSTN